MLASMTSSQFSEWQDYDCIDSFGQHREEFRHGQKMAQYANFKRTEEKQKVHSCFDYMSYTEKPEVKEIDLSDEQTQAQIDRDVFGM
jgi:hypothetical protein